ncbi:MAG: GNAT family N-acetyltransferase [Candidatus Tokpelaia sp.]|nr:MAG: GNAT family N-acetyltransferase [Candidatus Tokpelaia sp.]KAA6207040.1 MAG: GNAT family N-acetyltransferase [Candidatus Tokpelaia sp.]
MAIFHKKPGAENRLTGNRRLRPAKAGQTERAMPVWHSDLEPAYLLRLFFAYPPQDFTAYQQVIDKTGAAMTDDAANLGGAAGVSGEAGNNQGTGRQAGTDKVGAAGENTAAVETVANAANIKKAKKSAKGKETGEEIAAAVAGVGNTAAAGVNNIGAVEKGAYGKEAPGRSGLCGEAAGSGGRCGEQYLPLFSCRFNLLTSLEPAQLQKLQKLPFYKIIKKLLTFRSLFFGTTVSEFAPLPAAFSPALAVAAADYLLAQAKKYPLVIVKDLPQGENALVTRQQAAAGQNFAAALTARGFMAVEGQALAYVPVDYADIDAFLARFSKARRKDFRRKLRARQNLTIEVLHKGAAAFADEEQIDLYYRLYSQVYAQSTVHFDLLTRDFFRALLQQADDSLRFITYRDKEERLIGYNICFIIGNRLVDKYIGLDYPAATDYSLYFVSWFYNLAYAREQGLQYYVAGWTDPQVKACLGAKFIMTRHIVYIRNPLLRWVLRRCRSWFEAEAQIGASPAAGKTAGAEAAEIAGSAAGEALMAGNAGAWAAPAEPAAAGKAGKGGNAASTA